MTSDHRTELPIAQHEQRAIQVWRRRAPAFDLYRCGALHLTITTPDHGVPTCEQCQGEGLPPLLIEKWRCPECVMDPATCPVHSEGT